MRLTRKELYDQIWSEPIWTLAKKYGFSDVGLAKICRKHNIPRPPRGYWAQKKAGLRVIQAPLPKNSKENIIEITIRPAKHSETKEKETFRQKLGLGRRRISIPEVPDTLISPHPLVGRSEELLSADITDANGLMKAISGCLDICVTMVTFPRALRIFDTIIKFLIEKGFEVTVSGCRTIASILGIPVAMRIGEELARKHLKAIDHNLEEYSYEFGYKLCEKAPTPSGRLFLEVYDPENTSVTDRHLIWRDTELTKLETLLRRIVSGLARIAAAKGAQTTKRPEPD